MISTKIRSAGGNTFRIETSHDLPIASNEQYIKDAKAICEFLLSGIPSGTFDEVVACLRARRRNANMTSWSDEFQEHFVRRLKKLNKKSK